MFLSLVIPCECPVYEDDKNIIPRLQILHHTTIQGLQAIPAHLDTIDK